MRTPKCIVDLHVPELVQQCPKLVDILLRYLNLIPSIILELALFFGVLSYVVEE
jgi:hypothetical protein